MSGFRRAIILAGGKGTRLRPYTVTLPKPLVPVGDKAILEIVIEQLQKNGVTHVTLAVNHLAELLRAYFGDGSRFNVKIDYSLENTPLGTMGPLHLIKELPDDFLVMNGDILTDLDFQQLWNVHKKQAAHVTVCCYRRTLKVDFGVLDTNEQSYLSGFREKPLLTQLVSMGIYAFRKAAIEHIPANQPFGFDDLMLKFLKLNVPVFCHEHTGQWLDIGRPDDYERAQSMNVDRAHSVESL